MNYVRRLRNGLVLLAATLLLMVVIVVLTLLVAIAPGTVLAGMGLAVIAALLLYLFSQRTHADRGGPIQWRY